MAYLFDTDAISELLRARPTAAYVAWVSSVPREDQFVSATTIGELYHGAFRSAAKERHLENIESRVIPSVTVLPFDVAVAKVFGRIRAHLQEAGTPLEDAEVQIASTAIYHELELVTGNLKHFDRVPRLTLCPVLRDARA